MNSIEYTVQFESPNTPEVWAQCYVPIKNMGAIVVNVPAVTPFYEDAEVIMNRLRDKHPDTNYRIMPREVRAKVEL